MNTQTEADRLRCIKSSPKRKEVVNLDTGEVYPSLNACGRKFKVSASVLSGILSNNFAKKVGKYNLPRLAYKD